MACLSRTWKPSDGLSRWQQPAKQWPVGRGSGLRRSALGLVSERWLQLWLLGRRRRTDVACLNGWEAFAPVATGGSYPGARGTMLGPFLIMTPSLRPPLPCACASFSRSHCSRPRCKSGAQVPWPMAMGETEIKWRLWGAKKRKTRKERAGWHLHLLDKRDG